MRSIPLRLWALAILSALLQVLAFPIAGPAPLWRRLFCWFCFVPLLIALFGKDSRGAALKVKQTAILGYVCGFFWYMGNCYWIYQTMHLYGELPKAASLGILILFSLYVALYHALFGAWIGWLRKRYSVQAVLWIAPLVWVAVELARARVTGFPWDLLGYTQVDNLLLTRLAPWTGVFGLSLVVAFANSLWLWRPKLRYAGIAAAVAILLAAAIITMRPSISTDTTTATAVLLQENLNVGATATGAAETKQQLLASFDALTLQPSQTTPGAKKPDLIAWPEGPAPFFDADSELRTSMGSLAVEMQAPVIINALSFGDRLPDGHYEEFNSASFFLPDGSYDGHYDKMKLVPFGEYVPYKPLFFFAGDLLGNLPFVPGKQRRLLESNGKRYGIFICYESIFGDDIRHFVDNGAQVLVNISDDGWYGDSSAPWEHLDMVRMRAIENGRWVLRATNTGVTVAIDPEGRITAQLPRHIRGTLAANFAYSDHKTFYTVHGDWIAWLCAILAVVLTALVHAPRRAVN